MEKFDTGIYEMHISLLSSVEDISPIQLARRVRMKARSDPKFMYHYYQCIVYRRTMFSN